MAIDVSVVRDLTALRAIEAEWRALAARRPGALFRGPDWLIPWWLAYHNTLGAELHVLVGRATEDPTRRRRPATLVCLAPLYRAHRQGRAARHARAAHDGRCRPAPARRSICSRARAGRIAPAPRSRAR